MSGLYGECEQYGCNFAFVKYLDRRSGDLVCENPQLLKCRVCRRTIEARCRGTNENRCVPCGRRHGKDIMRVMRSGASPDRPDGFFFVTLTAPGADKLPWDKSICTHTRAVECSGANGCKVDEFLAAVWNDEAKQKWSWFVTEVRRKLSEDVQFAAAWESQLRGALHRHFLAHAQGVSVKKFEIVIREAAALWGFGVQVDVQAVSAATTEGLARKAGYIAKYATKGGKLAATIDRSTGEIKEGGYRRWSASRRWGVTLASVRKDRQNWVRVGLMADREKQATDENRLGSSVAALPSAEGALDSEKEIYALLL